MPLDVCINLHRVSLSQVLYYVLSYRVTPSEDTARNRNKRETLRSFLLFQFVRCMSASPGFSDDPQAWVSPKKLIGSAILVNGQLQVRQFP